MPFFHVSELDLDLTKYLSCTFSMDLALYILFAETTKPSLRVIATQTDNFQWSPIHTIYPVITIILRCVPCIFHPTNSVIIDISVSFRRKCRFHTAQYLSSMSVSDKHTLYLNETWSRRRTAKLE